MNTVQGADVRVGTILLFLGVAHTVTAVEEYPSPFGPAHIAYSGTDWHMTVFDDDAYEVVAEGRAA